MKKIRSVSNMLRPHVRNVMPSGQRNSIGPFIYMDHLGPYQILSGNTIRVPDHPHAGLATFSFLFDGEGFHTDNLGNKTTLAPGQLNFMKSGQGIIHSEGLSPQFSKNGGMLHGFQIWSFLSEQERKGSPSFHQYGTKSWVQHRVINTLIAGKFQGHEIPIPSDRELLILSLKSEGEETLKLPLRPDWEYLIYLCKGSAVIGTDQFQGFEGVCINDAHDIEIEVAKGGQILLMGGQPLMDQPMFYQSFVGSDQDEIDSFLSVNNYANH